MTRERTAKATYDVIEKLATDAFKEHTLVVSRALPSVSHSGKPAPFVGTFRLGQPGTSVYAVYIHVDTCVVAIWGDLGEFLVRHADGDSLGWLTSCGTSDQHPDGGGFCDYFLGKVRASDESRREFMIDDARAFLDHWETEVKNEYRVESTGEDDGDADLSDAEKRRLDRQLEQIAEVREVLVDVEHDRPSHQRYKWLEAMRDVGYDDPPDCCGWSPSMLWLWQAVKKFRQLYRENKRSIHASVA